MGALGGRAEGRGTEGRRRLRALRRGGREIHLLVTEPPASRPGRELMRLRLLRGRLGARAGPRGGARAGCPGPAVRPAPALPSPSVPRAPPVARRAPAAFSALPGAAGHVDFGAKWSKVRRGRESSPRSPRSEGPRLPPSRRPQGAAGRWGPGEAVPGAEAAAAPAEAEEACCRGRKFC